jgi:hypothetical protein
MKKWTGSSKIKISKTFDRYLKIRRLEKAVPEGAAFACSGENTETFASLAYFCAFTAVTLGAAAVLRSAKFARLAGTFAVAALAVAHSERSSVLAIGAMSYHPIHHPASFF